MTDTLHCSSSQALGSLQLLGASIDAITMRWFVEAPEEVWIEDELLRYSRTPSSGRRDATGMLEAFTRIRGNDDIVRFAKRFGVLGLCEHDLPATHRQDVKFLDSLEESAPGSVHGPTSRYMAAIFIKGADSYCTREHRYRCPVCAVECEEESSFCPECGESSDEYDYLERLTPWLGFVSQARAIVRIAEKLRRDVPGAPADWGALPELWGTPRSRSLRKQRSELAAHVSHWLRVGRVDITLEWHESEPTASIWAWTFGMIAAQLLGAIVGSDVPAICDGCNEIYLPARKPYANRAHTFCASCREKSVPARLRQRKHRERQRERRRHEDGKPKRSR